VHYLQFLQLNWRRSIE